MDTFGKILGSDTAVVYLERTFFRFEVADDLAGCQKTAVASCAEPETIRLKNAWRIAYLP